MRVLVCVDLNVRLTNTTVQNLRKYIKVCARAIYA